MKVGAHCARAPVLKVTVVNPSVEKMNVLLHQRENWREEERERERGGREKGREREREREGGRGEEEKKKERERGRERERERRRKRGKKKRENLAKHTKLQLISLECRLQAEVGFGWGILY